MASETRAPTEHLDSKANLRAALNCGQFERTVDAARRVAAERDALKQKVADLELAIRAAWGNADAAE